MEEKSIVSGLQAGAKRIDVYDWLRLFAMIFVVIGHSSYRHIQEVSGGVAYEFPDLLSASYDAWILTFCRKMSVWVYGFHMPLFFVLSGAVLALRPLPSFDRLVSSKMKRLIIPYFLFGWLFMFPIKYIADFYNSEGVLLAYKGFLIGEDSGHLWFLPALFWCILCFSLLKKIVSLKTDSVYLALGISGIISLTYTYLPFDILQLKTGLSYIFWFALGYTFETERKKYAAWSVGKIAFMYAITVLLEVLNVKYDLLNDFFVILIGTVHTYLLSDLCSRLLVRITNWKFWKILIRNLFYVYLFHDPLEYVVLKIFFSKELLVYSWGCYLYFFARTIGIFIISLIMGECIRFSKSLLEKFRMQSRV